MVRSPHAPAAPRPPRRRHHAWRGAVHDKIAGELGDKKIAEKYGTTRDDLQRWYDAYCAAGLAALGELP